MNSDADKYYIVVFFQIDGSNIDGVGVTVVSETIKDGGLLYDPIPGDILRTFNTNPQVMLKFWYNISTGMVS